MAKKTQARPEPKKPQQTTKARRGLNSNPRPRGKQQFDFGKNSRPKSGAPQDDRTMNPRGPRCDLVRPAWNGTTGTVVRLLPCYDINIEDDDVFAFGRTDCRDWQMADWIRGYRAVKYVGIDQKVTFLLMDPFKEAAGEQVWNANPYKLLNDAVHQAVKAEKAELGNKDVLTPRWANLVNKDPQNKKKAFNAATWLYFVQVAIYQHNGVVYVKDGIPPRGMRDDDITQILELSKSAGEDLIGKLDARHEEFNGDAEDFEQFLHPNPVDLMTGPFITIFNPKKHKRHEVVVGQQVEEATEKSEEPEEEEYNEAKDKARKSGGGDGGFQGWEIGLDDQFLYQNVTEGGETKIRKGRQKLDKWEPTIRDRLVWWDNVLWVPSFEEQATLLAAAFRSMPDILYFGWKDNEEYFTDEVKGILRARTSGPGAEVPGDDDDDEVVEESQGTTATSSRRTSAGVPQVEDDMDDEEVYEDSAPVEAEYTEESEDEGGDADDAAAEEEALDAAMSRAKARGGTQPTEGSKPTKKKSAKKKPQGETQTVPKKGTKKGTKKATVKKKRATV